MYQTEPVKHNLKEQLEVFVKNIMQELVTSDKTWTIGSIDCSLNQSEIHIYLKSGMTQSILCSQCNRRNLPSLKESNKVWTYFSLFGKRTFIHAEDLWIHCPVHGGQRVIPPWEKHINQELHLSIL